MRKWVLKAVLQKFFTVVPGGFKLNYWFQKHVTKAVRLNDTFFETMLDHYHELESYAAKNQLAIKNQRVFEIGTGWHPVVPLCFYLSGAKAITTVDLNGHLRSENLIYLFKKLQAYHAAGKLQKWLPQLDLQRLEKLQLLSREGNKNPQQMLAKIGIEQFILDAASTHFKDEYFDFCYSVNVFEHIAEKALPGISHEISRITKKGGGAYHAIGVYDHFQHVDPSLSKFNYLRFSRKQWRLIDNDIQPQNRLRISYFRTLFESNQWQVLEEIFQDAVPEDLAKINLHPDWQGVPEVDIPYGTFLLKKVNS